MTMPPGYYIFVLCVISISVVNGRGRSMTGSGYGQRDDEFGSGFPDDDTFGDDDDDTFSGTPVNPPSRVPTKCEMIRDSILHNAEPLDGVFIPRCTAWGEYKAVQCDRHSGECYCVNNWGQEIPYTRGRNVQEATCNAYDRESEYPPSPDRPNKRPGAGTGNGHDDGGFVVQPPRTERPTDHSDIIYEEKPKQPEKELEKPVVIAPAPEGEEDDLPTDTKPEDNHQGENLSRSIIQTPGLLPGIIGGAVVGLLCAVLLVMFIVYRMRKKDEGSYALEEPKMTSPSRGYTRAPTKEYWA